MIISRSNRPLAVLRENPPLLPIFFNSVQSYHWMHWMHFGRQIRDRQFRATSQHHGAFNDVFQSSRTLPGQP